MGHSGQPADRANAGDKRQLDRQLDLICDTAFSARNASGSPPWEFIFVRDEGRRLLGNMLVEAAQRRAPHAPRASLQPHGAKALLAPLIVALGSSMGVPGAIPEAEHRLVVGAIAMNILNAVHALGYGALWASGMDTDDRGVLEALGFQRPVRLAGFVFVGMPGEAGIPKR